MPAPIERDILHIDGRSVHVRQCGAGPPLVLLHQSPKTSAELTDRLEAWADKFWCLAPDHPGYGLSDPLPARAPSIDDLAAAHMALADALGLDRLLVYGFHTGAKIALAMAALYPDRIAGAVANGVLVNSPGDRQSLLQHYLPAFEAQADGSHLAGLWHRVQDQRIFFPWYDRRDATRLPMAPGDPETLQASAMDILAAGDAYRAGYGAALAVDSRAVLARLRTPTLVTGGPGDVLSAGLKALDTSDHVHVAAADSDAELDRQVIAFLHQHAPAAGEPRRPQIAGSPRLRPTLYRAGDRHLHGLAGGDGPITLVLPAPGGSVFELERMLQPLTRRHHILALDPPGHGWSDGDAPHWADALVDGLNAAAPTTIVAQGLGLAFVRALLAAGMTPPQRLVALDTVFDRDRPPAALLPDLTPDRGGGHLLAAWHAIRLGRLFFPWTDPRPETAIPSDGRLVTFDLHAATVALLNGWRAGRRLLGAHADLAQWTPEAVPQRIALCPAWAEARSDVTPPPAGWHRQWVDPADRGPALESALSAAAAP